MDIRYGVEGPTDAPIARRLIEYVGASPREVLASGGKSKLDARVRRWNSPGNKAAILVLRDWDPDDACICPVDLTEKITRGGVVAPGLCLRIAVRATEAWLMADPEACATYFGVQPPADPDALSDPKRALIDACRRSPRRRVREGMVPRSGTGARAGPEYAALVVEYGRNHWDLRRALPRSDSLRRAAQALEKCALSAEW